jgi:hypothetical protein
LRLLRALNTQGTAPLCFQANRSAAAISTLPKLDAAVFLNRDLFERVHLAFEATNFRSVAPVPSNEKRRGPEHDDCNTGNNAALVAWLS